MTSFQQPSVPGVLQHVTEGPTGRFGGMFERLPHDVYLHMSEFNAITDNLSLKGTSRSMYKVGHDAMINHIVLILDDSASMSMDSRTSRMVDLVRRLAASWRRSTRILVMFVSGFSMAPELRTYHNTVVTPTVLLETICPLLEKFSTGIRTNLCSGLLDMHHVGPTIIITDGEENGIRSLSSIMHLRLPCHDKDVSLTVGAAIERYNHGAVPTEQINPTTMAPMTALLLLLRAFNPAYFLGAVVHADNEDHTDTHEEIIMHYNVSGEIPALVEKLNHHVIPLEYGGGRSSRPRVIVQAERARCIRSNQHLRDLVIRDGITGDTKDTFRVMLASRHRLLKPGSDNYVPPSTSRVSSRSALGHENLLKFIAAHGNEMKLELAQTAEERRDRALVLFADERIRNLVLANSQAKYLLKIDAAVKKRQTKKKDTTGPPLSRPSAADVHIVLRRPAIHSHDYVQYMEARGRMTQWRIEIRAPIDWLTVHMSLQDLGIESPYPMETLHDNILRRMMETPRQRYDHKTVNVRDLYQ
jgi:hypothetical protein